MQRLARLGVISCLLLVTVLMLRPSGGEAFFPITEFVTPTAASSPIGITLGPDLSMWFVENGTSKIGRITPAGVITEFPTLTAGAFPTWITVGPDGNLWFTEFTASKIGRITTAGVVTEFGGLTGSGPLGIVAGPDGNLWFADFGSGDKIGRITPAGTVTEFPIPTVGAGPDRIAVGLDGNLWFTERGGSKIGRITTAGAITEFPIPTPTSQPRDIVRGPDGNLWFAMASANRIGVITTAGQFVKEYIVAGGPDGINTGPGGIWFTERGSTKIGRIIAQGTPGDFDFDGKADFLVGAGPGGGPHVRVLSGLDKHELRSLFAYDLFFTGGVRVAACDLNGDGVPEIVTAAGFGGGPHIRAFDGRTGNPFPLPVGSFFAYDPGLVNGAFVGCADLDGDGVPDIVTGAGPGGAPHVRGFSGIDLSDLGSFFPFDPGATGGVFVGP